MPDFFRRTSGHGDRSLLQRATSSLFRSLRNIIAPSEPEWTPHINPAYWTTSQASSEDELEDDQPSDVSLARDDAALEAFDMQDSSDSDADSMDEDGAPHPTATDGPAPTPANEQGEQLETDGVNLEARPGTSQSQTPSSSAMRSSPRAGSRHLYRYSASPFSASSTNLAAHLNNSPVRSHRDFLRAPSSSSRGTASRAAISPPPSSAERSGNRSSSAGRGRKRSRDAGEDNSPDSEGMPSALQSSSRRPKRRRPLFIPRPFCTRETCLGRNLHLLEDSSSSRPGVSDSEDTWSTTAQPPSDSERDPVPELDHLEYRRRLFRKRKRAEGKGYGEGGPSSKRRKGGER